MVFRLRVNYPLAVAAIARSHSGVSFWRSNWPASSGHAVDPKEQELEITPYSPWHHPDLSALPYSSDLSRIGNHVGPRRSAHRAIFPRRCHQAPPWAFPGSRLPRKRECICTPTLRPYSEVGAPGRPKRGTSRGIAAWPLRYGPLPNRTGFVPRIASSSSDFCTGTDPHR